MIEERIKANLEALHAQISAFTEMMDMLIQARPENLWRQVPASSDFNPIRLSLKHPGPQGSRL